MSDARWLDERVGDLQLGDLPPAYADVARAHLAATRQYREAPFAGQVTLVRARRLIVFSTTRWDLG